MKKKTFTPPSLDEVKEYFSENGYSQELAERFFKGYEVAEWHDSTGKPVKNWKQKAIQVWFRPENKIKNGQVTGKSERERRVNEVDSLMHAISNLSETTNSNAE